MVTKRADLIVRLLSKELGRKSEAVAGFKDALDAGQTLGIPWLLFESQAAMRRTLQEK